MHLCLGFMVKPWKQEAGNSDLVAKLLVLSMMPQSLSPVQELQSCELWGEGGTYKTCPCPPGTGTL